MLSEFTHHWMKVLKGRRSFISNLEWSHASIECSSRKNSPRFIGWSLCVCTNFLRLFCFLYNCHSIPCYPQQQNTCIIQPTHPTLKYYSRKLAHFLPICIYTIIVAVKQGQRGLDNKGYMETVPNQDGIIRFFFLTLYLHNYILYYTKK